MSNTPRLKDDYSNKIVKQLKDKLSLTNIMQVPSLVKIIISRGVGAAVSDKKLVEHAVEELTLISGQKAIATLSKKESKEIERGVKKIITDIVRALGGSEQTGGRLLLPAIEKVQFGDHSIRSLRLPADSAATQMTSGELEAEILEAWWTGSENPELGARKLRAILTPKQQ